MTIEILFWVSIIAGGILIILMLLSLIGGLDLDMDLGSSEVDTDSGGLGVIKGFLTFISVSSWVIKIMLATQQHPGIAIGIGIVTGIFAFMLLNYILRLLLKNESNVNWHMDDALLEKGEVYLKIPGDQKESGIVQIEIKGALRELKAKSAHGKEIKTGEPIRVLEVDGEYVLVEKENL